MPTYTHGDHLKLSGPDTGLARVLETYEADGHHDPARAWQSLTGTWNWAAPLPTAVPATDSGRKPVACPADGGFLLSGQWHLPSSYGGGAWLALPLASAPQTGPDIFVVSSRVLPGAVGDSRDDGRCGPSFRLEGTHVPAGFVTHQAATPLQSTDAVFLWTAAAALALGAARRMTDVLAHPFPGGAASAPAVAMAGELAAVLHDERVSMAAVLHGTSSARQGLPRAGEEQLARHVQRIANVVSHVVAATYAYMPTPENSGGQHPLVGMIEAGSPILQQVRYVLELLPQDRTCTQR
ncbi:hypothetical protein [Actinacidiphila glaucinigra]|uniref:hypothetical protein n=1 Tax=Actinacidiphila glaucinigra TaxID=235986 RepID=UPI00366BA9C9